MQRRCIQRIYHLFSIQEDVRNAIKPVIKKASAGNTSTNIVNTNCNLFLLSEIEIFGSTIFSAAGEGTQYTYWSQHNNNNDRRKGYKDTPTSYLTWWERSPFISSNGIFCCVNLRGEANSTGVTNALGVSFAFCI